MHTWSWAVLWIVVIVGGIILFDTVPGVSLGQIGWMIAVILCLGFIILGLHLSCFHLNTRKRKNTRANILGKKKNITGL